MVSRESDRLVPASAHATGTVHPTLPEIFNAHLPELAVSIVQPDLDAFVREGLLDNKVWYSVLVHILSRDCERRIVRGKHQVTVFPG